MVLSGSAIANGTRFAFRGEVVGLESSIIGFRLDVELRMRAGLEHDVSEHTIGFVIMGG